MIDKETETLLKKSNPSVVKINSDINDAIKREQLNSVINDIKRMTKLRGKEVFVVYGLSK